MEEEQTTNEARKRDVEKRYLKYTFFKVAGEERFREGGIRKEYRTEFLEVLRKEEGSVELSFFSLVGIRGDADFMILASSAGLDAFQNLVSSLHSTGLGRYLEMPYSYLAMSRRSHYVGSHKHPDQEGTERKLRSRSKFLFVYPFIKKREWYKLPFVERQRMMAEHFKIGHKYPRIRINTGYSFGLDD